MKNKINFLIASLFFLSFITTSNIVYADATQCSATKRAEILAPATSLGHSVTVNCSITLQPTDVVTKRILVTGAAGSDTIIDCNGAMLDGSPGAMNEDQPMVTIYSRQYTDSSGDLAWERVEDVTIRNCDIFGTVRLHGMGGSGNSTNVRDSSRQPSHVSRVRNAAPRYITLENVIIEPDYNIPLYLGPGVSYFTLVDSVVSGASHSVAIYLDAETQRNVIKNNLIDTDTGNDREILALDGSSNNSIISNHFSNLENGGIFLYRNCGEAGTIRVSTPSYNHIINNVFYYNTYTGPNPSVYIGSRNGNRNYCDEDAGWTYGSSVDNRDFAVNNVVMQNQIYQRSVSDMIKVGGTVNTGSVILYNTGNVSNPINRQAGCYLSNGYLSKLILDNSSTDLFASSNGEPLCNGLTYSCDNNELSVALTNTCSLQTVNFSCSISNSNNGCSGTKSCPTGTTLVGGVAACNLEIGSVTQTQLDETPWNNIEVVLSSDNVSQGSCWVGSNTVSSGLRDMSNVLGLSNVPYGCDEYDSNGGDCHIRGTFWCYQ